MQISHVKLTSTTLQNLVANKEKIVQLFEAGDIGGARKRMRTAQYPDGGAVQVEEGERPKHADLIVEAKNSRSSCHLNL